VASASTFPRSLPRARVLGAMVRRDFLISRSYRLAFVLDGFFGLVNLAVFLFISRTFGDATTAELNGAPSYFAFAAVGISLTVVIDATATLFARRIRDEQVTGTLEAVLTQPISIAEFSFGLAAFPLLFGVVRALAYLLVAAAWIGLDAERASWTGFAAILVSSGAAFAAVGVLLGAIVLVIKRGQVVVGMVVFTMGVLGGALFPIEVLPAGFEAVGRVLPTRFAFDGIRSAMFTGEGWTDDVAILLVYGALGIPAAIWTFTQALSYSRHAGTLTQY
jgi:ABC-2 type transport system permease protein